MMNKRHQFQFQELPTADRPQSMDNKKFSKWLAAYKPLLAKFLSLLLPAQLWANRILIVAEVKKETGKS